MKQEFLVQVRVMVVGTFVGSLWPLLVWCAHTFGGGILFRDWWQSTTAWSFVGPVAVALIVGVIPMSSPQKGLAVASLLAPAILMSFLQYCRIGS
ncbi:MAG: hypothetical protein V4671_01960 [Armatimonadota bacterium]